MLKTYMFCTLRAFKIKLKTCECGDALFLDPSRAKQCVTSLPTRSRYILLENLVLVRFFKKNDRDHDR